MSTEDATSSSTRDGELPHPAASEDGVSHSLPTAEASSSRTGKEVEGKEGKEDADSDSDKDAGEDSREDGKAEKEEERGNDGAEEDEFTPVIANAHTQGDWQAIWSPQHNNYYFYNLRTKETTWSNPLQPSDDTAASSAGEQAASSAEAAALAAGIDPALAYLDPTLAGGAGGPSNPAAYSYAARFNARTGAFTAMDGRNPDHVSEYERMKRMNSFYFDNDAWERSVEEGHAEAEAAGKKRKKPTKKDLESFKEKKKAKKLAKTAWLRT